MGGPGVKYSSIFIASCVNFKSEDVVNYLSSFIKTCSGLLSSFDPLCSVLLNEEKDKGEKLQSFKTCFLN